MGLNGLEGITFADAVEWESSLAEHHDTYQGVSMKIAKKGSRARSASATAALEVAPCFGGRWDAADESERAAAVPPDLEAARDERVRETDLRLSRQIGSLWLILRLLKARTPDERALQLDRLVARLERVWREP
jgi:hypothetical protein